MPAFRPYRHFSFSLFIGALAAVASGAIPLVLGGFSLYNLLEAAMIVLSFVPAGAAIASGRLPVGRHLPMWMLYAQAVIYLYIAPAAYVATGMPDRSTVAPIYVALQLAILGLFLIPLLLLYSHWVTADGTLPLRWRMSRPALAVFIPLCLILSPLYIALLARDGLLFRRIGFAGIAQAFVQLPRTDFLAIRGFEALAVPLLCLHVLAVRAANGWWRFWLVVSLASTGAGTLLDAVLNSRLQVVFVFVLPLIVFLNVRSTPPRLSVGSSKPWRVWVAAAVVCVAVLYGFRVTENVRVSYPKLHLVPQQFSPLFDASKYGGSDTPLAFRLNGLDLMARITPRALTSGFSGGKSWWPSIVVELGQLIDPALANRYKLSGATEPKWYLMRDYQVADLTDYPSSSLTDVYGNLGPIGLPLAAAAYAILIAILTRWTRTGSAAQVGFALFLLADVAYFEGSFIGIALRWVHYAPALLLLLAINPLRRDVQRGQPGNRADKVDGELVPNLDWRGTSSIGQPGTK